MKSELLHIEALKINSFIWHCIGGSGRMVVRGKQGNKAVIDSGKYIVRKDGKFITQKSYPQRTLCDIMKRLIDKYERFEYDGNLYHSPEMSIWVKEEL